MSALVQRLLVGAAIVVVAFLLFKSFNVESPKTDTPFTSFSDLATKMPPASANQTSQIVDVPTQFAIFGDQNPATPDPDVPFTPVVELAGTSSQRTQSFRLSGGVVKLRYHLDV